MEELINALLKNPFLLILVIGGLFSLFKGKGKQDGEEEAGQDARSQQQTGEQQPKKRPESITETIRKTIESLDPEAQTGKTIQEKSLQMASVEEQRKKQLERLSNQVATNSMNYEDISKPHSQSSQQVKSKEVRDKSGNEFKNNFKKSLSRDGLKQSVIMAEVLGLPRSRRPYQSVVTNRRNR